MLKGNFIQPILYKKYISGEREFNINKYYNIRKSTFSRKFINCVFHIHNGRYYVKNDPIDLILNSKKSKNLSFKLGQFSYNKHIHKKSGFNTNRFLNYLFEDIKKKRGLSIKNKKKKKLVFVSK